MPKKNKKINRNITPKERNLIKGALRRVFARSDLHRQVVDRTRVDYKDLMRPRVKKWSKCEQCKLFTPTYQITVDHIDPIIPTDNAFENMLVDDVINRLWCNITNLQGLCEPCHDQKTAKERVERKTHKGVKNGKNKRSKTAKGSNAANMSGNASFSFD